MIRRRHSTVMMKKVPEKGDQARQIKEKVGIESQMMR
jgi:hypothetical protein